MGCGASAGKAAAPSDAPERREKVPTGAAKSADTKAHKKAARSAASEVGVLLLELARDVPFITPVAFLLSSAVQLCEDAALLRKDAAEFAAVCVEVEQFLTSADDLVAHEAAIAKVRVTLTDACDFLACLQRADGSALDRLRRFVLSRARLGVFQDLRDQLDAALQELHSEVTFRACKLVQQSFDESTALQSIVDSRGGWDRCWDDAEARSELVGLMSSTEQLLTTAATRIERSVDEGVAATREVVERVAGVEGELRALRELVQKQLALQAQTQAQLDAERLEFHRLILERDRAYLRGTLVTLPSKTAVDYLECAHYDHAHADRLQLYSRIGLDQFKSDAAPAFLRRMREATELVFKRIPACWHMNFSLQHSDESVVSVSMSDAEDGVIPIYDRHECRQDHCPLVIGAKRIIHHPHAHAVQRSFYGLGALGADEAQALADADQQLFGELPEHAMEAAVFLNPEELRKLTADEKTLESSVDMFLEPGFVEGEYRPCAKRMMTRVMQRLADDIAYVGVPVALSGATVGALCCFFCGGYEPGEEDLQVLEQCAELASRGLIDCLPRSAPADFRMPVPRVPAHLALPYRLQPGTGPAPLRVIGS